MTPVFALVLSMEMTSLAASYTAGTAQEIQDALNNESENSDEEITITLTADILEALTFAAQEGKTITVNGDQYVISDVQISGTGNMILNTNIEGTGDYTAALMVEGYTLVNDTEGNGLEAIANETSSGLSVTVNGDITGKDGQGQVGASVNNATLNVTGDIIGGGRRSQGNVSDGTGLSVVSGGGDREYHRRKRRSHRGRIGSR